MWDILIAEDNGDTLVLLVEAFRRLTIPCRFRLARDGTEVVAYLHGWGEYADREANPVPNILLLDLDMPKMGGYEVLEWLQRHPFPGLHIFVFSDNDNVASVDRAYALGAEMFLLKPQHFEELIGLLERIALLKLDPESKLDTKFLRLSSLSRPPAEGERSRQ